MLSVIQQIYKEYKQALNICRIKRVAGFEAGTKLAMESDRMSLLVFITSS
jgi:hypothetical protein